MWLSPAAPGPRATVRARIVSFSLDNARQTDEMVTYLAPAAPPATAGASCGVIFQRPKVGLRPTAGIPGTLTYVSYTGHYWAKIAVAVQAATAPSAAGLRACLKDGRWHVTGHGALGGARVVELASVDGYLRLWVSATTFLPVRLTSAGQGLDTITFAFKFLAPTAANQAALTPPIPAGFHKRSV
jgi:hypothetical protein